MVQSGMFDRQTAAQYLRDLAIRNGEDVGKLDTEDLPHLNYDLVLKGIRLLADENPGRYQG